MDPQLKKGLIEVCVLKTISTKPSYGYKIISDVSKYIEITESTLYPILKRLEISKYVTSYTEEYNSRLRKYYKITDEGQNRLKLFKEEYKQLRKITNYITGVKVDE